VLRNALVRILRADVPQGAAQISIKGGDSGHAGRIALSECLSRSLVGVGEVPGPFRLGEFAVLKIPEILVDAQDRPGLDLVRPQVRHAE
jgi:hypothetical protein